VNEQNTDLIRRRARLLKASHPALAQLIDTYVTRQEQESRILGTGTELLGATWVLRRI